MILNGGNIPFVGDKNEEIQNNILHSSDNKFSVLKEKLQQPNNTSDDEREYNQWMDISDDLFDIINGLLTKDAKKRYTIDYILWNNWIPKMKYEFIYRAILRYWIRIYAITDDEEEILNSCCSMISIANNINLSAHSGQLSYHNNYRSVIHQFKLFNYTQDGEASAIKSDCYCTISSNIWCKHYDNPVTIDYIVNFAKYDIYFGIICCNEYKKDMSYYHFIGSDPNSISLSIRYGKAWFNSNEVSDIKRKEYLRQNIINQRNKLTAAQRIFNIQQTSQNPDDQKQNRNDGMFCAFFMMISLHSTQYILFICI